MKYVFLLAIVLPLTLAQDAATEDDESDNNAVIKLISKYPEVRRVNIKKLWGDAPELKITVILRNEECSADDEPAAENSCKTNPDRDCSCFEEKLKTYKYGFQQTIKPLGADGPSFRVFCSNLDGKLWTVITERIDSNADELEGGFNQNSESYENGFGELEGNHFVGLKNLHALTSAADMRLKIEMTNEDYDFRAGEFRTFKVGSEDDDYELTIGQHSGILGSSIVEDSNGQPFSAKGNDVAGNGCPAKKQAGWWFADNADCGSCNLNGPIGTDLFSCDVANGSEKGTAVTFYVTPNDYLDA